MNREPIELYLHVRKLSKEYNRSLREHKHEAIEAGVSDIDAKCHVGEDLFPQTKGYEILRCCSCDVSFDIPYRYDEGKNKFFLKNRLRKEWVALDGQLKGRKFDMQSGIAVGGNEK